MAKAVPWLLPLLTLILVGDRPGLSAPTDSLLIVPGRSIGSITLGMPKKLIVAGWGHPERVRAGLEDVYVYERFKTSIAFGVGDAVVKIRTWHPSMRTREGIGVGSKAAVVHAIFGRPQETKAESFLDALRALGVLPGLYSSTDGFEWWIDFEDFYHTRGISFTSRKRFKYLGINAPESARTVELDKEPMVTHITVERPR